MNWACIVWFAHRAGTPVGGIVADCQYTRSESTCEIRRPKLQPRIGCWLSALKSVGVGLSFTVESTAHQSNRDIKCESKATEVRRHQEGQLRAHQSSLGSISEPRRSRRNTKMKWASLTGVGQQRERHASPGTREKSSTSKPPDSRTRVHAIVTRRSVLLTVAHRQVTIVSKW